jgi:hypothetical protein
MTLDGDDGGDDGDDGIVLIDPPAGANPPKVAPVAMPVDVPYPSSFPKPNERAATVGGEVPDEVVAMGWCWGAMAFTWMWGQPNKVPITYLSFVGLVIPVVGWIFLAGFTIWLGMKGHELAWKGGRFDNIEEFRETMRVWNAWGLWTFVATGVLGGGLAVMLGVETLHFLRS